MDRKWKCRKCGEELVIKKTLFDYLERSFSDDLPRCPKCGKVLISSELAGGRMTDVEEMLEGK